MDLTPARREMMSPVKSCFIFIVYVASWFTAYFSSLCLESCLFKYTCSFSQVCSEICFFFSMGTFSQCCFDLLIRSVSLVNQIGENHGVEKFSGRKQICSKIKGFRSTAVYCTDNQKAFNSQI